MNDEKGKSGLQDFRGFFGEFLGLIVGGVATTALVLVTALLDLAPPWPPALVPLTALAQLIALIFVYQIARKSRRTKITRLMRNALIIVFMFLALYLAMYSLLVFQMPDASLGLRGLSCTAEAMRVYPDHCPLLPKHLIADAEFTADRLWTPFGLLASRLILLAGWLGFFAAIVTLVGGFIVYQRRVKIT